MATRGVRWTMFPLPLLAILGTAIGGRSALADDVARVPTDVDVAVEALGLPVGGGASPDACAPSVAGLRCRLEALYRDDDDARASALGLWERHGTVAGLESPWVMDGGFRGRIRIVPARPVGRDARHLRWVVAAHDHIATVLARVAARSPRPVRYRHDRLVYRFFRSVGRTTPSAYASGWQVGYNVAGSLHRSAAAVESTLVHEIFHLNDGVDGWTSAHLADLHRAILARCGTVARCLAPYAPTSLRVRGGTYYAFQPNNGDAVAEYGADLASRWFDEQRAMLETGHLTEAPWKCRTIENADAYARVADAFFGGFDATPPCGD